MASAKKKTTGKTTVASLSKRLDRLEGMLSKRSQGATPRKQPMQSSRGQMAQAPRMSQRTPMQDPQGPQGPGGMRV
ncbi:unnamed protein product [marine sediment metagenome]|uniref:Uncharacterized protein n=1 Tax=marine sediment metagenome TaxID=412755 RepID=X1BX19_9ZZZZ